MVTKIMNRPIRQIVDICQRSYVETLIVMSTTCFGLLCHVLNGSTTTTTTTTFLPKKNAMSFKQVFWTQCFTLYFIFIFSRSKLRVHLDSFSCHCTVQMETFSITKIDDLVFNLLDLRFLFIYLFFRFCKYFKLNIQNILQINILLTFLFSWSSTIVCCTTYQFFTPSYK